VPGGLALTVPLVLAAFAVAASGSIVLAGSLPAPGAEQIVRAGGWIALSASFSFVLALGIGSALGSRGMTIGVLLGWQLAIAPMLAGLEGLGSLRVGLDYAALQKLHPAAIAADGRGVAMSAATAALVLAAWIALTLGAGAWRTARRDT
jgi:hypothetical protein